VRAVRAAVPEREGRMSDGTFSNYDVSVSATLSVADLLEFSKRFARPPIVRHFAFGIDECAEISATEGPPRIIWLSDDMWHRLKRLATVPTDAPSLAPTYTGIPCRRCPSLMDPYAYQW
jgi:hypothetical protein